MAFGEILKQKRLELGWTKEYVSERTHLMVRNIDLMESESFKKLPAPIYVRGHIRLYAKLVGLDPEPLVEDYGRQIAGDVNRSRTVTHPDVKGPPVRPLEPIHTGAHRTMPPREPILPDASLAVTSHKLVEPAEATYTSVPKPEVAPAHSTKVTPAPEPDLFAAVPPVAEPVPETPAPSDFTLAGDTLPTSKIAPEPRTLPPPTHPHRAIFSSTFDNVKRGRTIVPRVDRSDELSQGGQQRRIFGAHEPAKPTPIKPEPAPKSKPKAPTPQPETQKEPIKTLCKDIADGCTGIVTRATRPKIERLHGDEGHYGTPRMYHQALLIFLILVGLTGVILLFRYIFRLSDSASTEYGLAPQSEFKPRPVATPPEAFFE